MRVLYALAVFLLALPASAQTTWTAGAGTSDWCTAANWDSGVPTASTVTYIYEAPGGVFPQITGTESCAVVADDLYVNETSLGGKLLISGGTLTVTDLFQTRSTGGDNGVRMTSGTISTDWMRLYGDHETRFRGGTLRLTGHSEQSQFDGTFRPQGTEVVVDVPLATNVHTLYFANGGVGAGQSYVQDLTVARGRASLATRMWVTRALDLTGGSLTGGINRPVHLVDRLPVFGPSTNYDVSLTYFYGSRTVSSGTLSFPDDLVIGNADASDGLGGEVRVEAGAAFELPGKNLTTYTDAEGAGLVVDGGTVEADQLTLFGDASANYTGGTLRLTGHSDQSQFNGTFRPDETEVVVDLPGPTLQHSLHFANGGVGPGQSYVQDLTVANGLATVVTQMWVTRALDLTGGSLTGGINRPVHLVDRFPTFGPSTNYNVSLTYFYGSRTVSSGTLSFPDDLQIGNADASDGLGGEVRVEAGAAFELPGKNLTTYTDAEGAGLVIDGGTVETDQLVLFGDASANYTGGTLRLTGHSDQSQFNGTFRPDETEVVIDLPGSTLQHTLRFQDAGIGPGQSYVQDLTIANGRADLATAMWVTRRFDLTSANRFSTASNRPVHLLTQLPTFGTGTYDPSLTYFYGTRTVASGVLSFPDDLYIGNPTEGDGLGGEVRVEAGASFILPGKNLRTYTNADGAGLVIAGGTVEADEIRLFGDASANYTGGTLRLTGHSDQSQFNGTFRPDGTTIVVEPGGPTLVHTLYFANAGTGAGQSYVQDLRITNGRLSLATNIAITQRLAMDGGDFTPVGRQVLGSPFLYAPEASGADRPYYSGTQAVTFSGASVGGLRFTSSAPVTLDIADPADFVRWENVEMTSTDTTTPRLTIRHPGGVVPLSDPVFSTNASNAHLAAIDTAPGDGTILEVPVIRPTPQTAVAGANYTEASGADVIWDAPPVVTLAITGTEGWRMLSGAFADATYDDVLGPLWTQGFSGSDDPGAGYVNVYRYNEAVTTDTNNDGVIDKNDGYVPITSQTAAIPDGVGHFVYVYADDDGDTTPDPFPKTVQQSSTVFNPAPFSFPVSFTDSPADDALADGWNLLGNPWETSMDWDAAGWTRSGMSDVLYVWDADNAGGPQYVSWNGAAGGMGSGVIAPNQGFWAKATGPAPVLDAPAAAKAAGGASYNITSTPEASGAAMSKSGGAVAVLGMKVEGSVGGVLRSNGAWATFRPEASLTLDRWDAYELDGWAPEAVQLFWVGSEGAALDIASLPSTRRGMRLPLGIRAVAGGQPTGGTFTLTWPDLDVPPDWRLALVDLETGDRVRLDRGTSYTFVLNGSQHAAAPRKRAGDLAPVAPRVLTGTSSLPGARASRGASARHAPATRFVVTLRTGHTSRLSDSDLDALADEVLAEARASGEAAPLAPEALAASSPEAFALYAPAPNPARGALTVRYDLAENGPVRLSVLDALGREVAVLASGEVPAGQHAETVDTALLAPGVYTVHLAAGRQSLTRRFTVVR